MKKLILLASVLAAGALGLQDVTTGHGGTYRGPGDTVPPGGGGGGNGGGPPTPGPNGPSGPGGSAPTTPGPKGPTAPGNNPGSGPVTPTHSAGVDRTQWQFWWGFNKDPYLNLKSHIHSPSTVTGSDEFYLGWGQKESSRDTLAPSEEKIRSEIVPALLRALETETDNDIVTGALIALAKIGDDSKETGESEFERVFAQFLGDPNQEIAETAATALGILGNPRSIPLLASLALDEPEARKLVGDESGVKIRTRSFATFGLGQIGYRCSDPQVRRDVVELLWGLCESPRGRTRDLKVAAVIALGLVPLDLDPAGGDLEAAEGGESLPPRTREEQIRYLLDFFRDDRDKDKHYLVRAHAPRSIVRLMEGLEDSKLKLELVQALAPYVTQRGHIGEQELRQSASLAFGMLGDLDADPADVTLRQHLQQAVANSDVMVKHFSVMALGQVGGRLGQGDQPGSATADVRKFLTNQYTRGKSSVEPWAALALGVMERGQLESGADPSADTLRTLRTSLAKERSSSDAGALAIALGIARDLDSEQVLLTRLQDMSEDEVRGYLAIGLGLMGSDASMETIQGIVVESKYRGELLKQAAIALGLLGDGKLVGTLVDMLAGAKTLTTQAAIASALGFIGDSRSVDPLIEMLADETISARARGFAGAALGIVADKEALPWNAKFSVDINYLANTATLTGADGAGLLDIL